LYLYRVLSRISANSDLLVHVLSRLCAATDLTLNGDQMVLDELNGDGKWKTRI